MPCFETDNGLKSPGFTLEQNISCDPASLETTKEHKADITSVAFDTKTETHQNGP